MHLLRIALVILGVFSLTADGMNLGISQSSKCVTKECDFPKTAAECEACAKSIDKSRYSMEDGRCWVLVASTNTIDCVLRTVTNFLGCPGFQGTNHYINYNCWTRFKPAVQRRRRDIWNSWTQEILKQYRQHNTA